MSKKLKAKCSELSTKSKTEHVVLAFLVKFHKVYYTTTLLRS